MRHANFPPVKYFFVTHNSDTCAEIVPEGHPTIAQRFDRWDKEIRSAMEVLEGRLTDDIHSFLSSPPGLARTNGIDFPAVELLGYYRSIPPG